MIEQHAIFGAPGEVVQANAKMLQEALDTAQLAGFAAGDQASAGKIAPTAAEPCSARDPAQHLQIAQTAWAFLAVRFERVGGVVETRIALLLLELLGLVKAAHVERGVVALVEFVKQSLVTGEEARLEQRCLYGDVIVGDVDALIHRAYRMADLQPDIPQRAHHVRQALAHVGVRGLWQEHQHIDIGCRKQFAAPVAAHGQQAGLRRHGTGLPDADDLSVDELRTPLEQCRGARLRLVGAAQGG